MARREPLAERCSLRAGRLALWLLFPTVAWGVIQMLEMGRALAQASQTVESEEQVKQLIVMLRGTLAEEKFNGAGVIVGQNRERLYIATSHHVVRQGTHQAERLEGQFKWLPGEWKNVRILEQGDTDLDLAVLAADAREVSVPDLAWGALGDLKALKPRDRVFPIGFPNNESWFRPVQPHVVNNVTGQHIRTEGQLFPGNSGGALVTEDWHLVGLVSNVTAMLGASFRIDSILDRIRAWGFPVGLTPAAVAVPAPTPTATSKPRDARLEDADPTPSNRTIYVINPTKDLLWYQHTGREDGTYEWVGPKTVGNGWTFRHVFPGDDGVIYAITAGGELLWFRHDGRATGGYQWATSEGKVVGVGWNVRHAFSGGGGVIYAIAPNGDLLWNRHEGRKDGSFRWAAPTSKTVGNGWNFRTVFSGGDGVIYTVSPAGELLWFRHDGRADGSYRWATSEGKVVGVGWNVRHAFSGGGGVIYAVMPNGDLVWNRHEGREDGSFRWSAPTGRTVGNGWTFEHIFSGANLQ